MSFTAAHADIWALILEKSDYDTIRRVFMTGSTLMRRAVARIRTLKTIFAWRRAPSLAMLRQMSGLQDYALSTVGITNKTQYVVLPHVLGCSRLRKLKLELPRILGTTAAPFPDILIKDAFPCLEQLILRDDGCFEDENLREKLISGLTPNLTLLEIPTIHLRLKTLKLLPSTITSLCVSIIAPSNIETESFEFPQNLTSLTLSGNTNYNFIYTFIPPSVTEFTIQTMQHQIAPPLHLLPRTLVSLSLHVHTLTQEIITSLPPDLLTLDLATSNPIENVQILKFLPSTLVYLHLAPTSYLTPGYEEYPLRDVLTLLPPRLTGLNFKFRKDETLRSLPGLEMSIPKDQLKQIIYNMVLERNAIAEGKKNFNSSVAKSNGLISFEEIPTEQQEEPTSFDEMQRQLYWKIPENFRRIRLEVLYTPQALSYLPKSTQELFISPSSYSESDKSPKNFDGAEFVKTQLTKLRLLNIKFPYPALMGITDGIVSHLEFLSIPLALLRKGQSFPKTLKTLIIAQENAMTSTDTDVDILKDNYYLELVKSLPPTLTELRIFPKIFSDVFPSLPRSLRLWQCKLLDQEANLEHFKKLPDSLTELRVDLNAKEIFSMTELVRSLPRSLTLVAFLFPIKIDKRELLKVINLDSVLPYLPKGVLNFLVQNVNLITERDESLAKL